MIKPSSFFVFVLHPYAFLLSSGWHLSCNCLTPRRFHILKWPCMYIIKFVFLLLICLLTVIVQLQGCVCFFATPWTTAHQAFLSLTISQTLLKLTSIELVMPSNHLILCWLLLLLPSICPSSSVFPMSQLFASGSQVLEFQLQQQSVQWIFLGLIFFRIDWFDLADQGTPRVFPNTAIWKHLFFGTQPSLWSNSHICTWLLEIP